ncbi:MAG: phage holin family protein [Actinobacteria bacterium]|nr:phage holin family protein [Actinomycetota bacterium]
MNGPQPPGSAGRSTADLLRDISQDTRELVRAEVELAKLELRNAVKARIIGVVALASAALMALYILFWLTFALFAGLANAMSDWLAALVTALILILITAPAVVIGVAKMRRPSFRPDATIETIEENVAWAKRRLQS